MESRFDLKGKRVLVTGGAGFIGTNLINRLLELGANVLSIDVRQPKIREHFACFKLVDMKNKEELKEVMLEYEPTWLIHLAARTDLGGTSLKDYDDNILAVKNLCESMCFIDSLQAVVFASSMLVCRVGHIPQVHTEYSPNTLYGKSKVLSENIIHEYSVQFKFDHYIVRPTSIWGPWFSEPYLPFFKRVIEGSYYKIGSKACTKTYGYVGNAVNQIISLLLCGKGGGSRLWYLGDSPPLNIDDWADHIAISAGVRRPLRLPWGGLWFLAKMGDVLSAVGIRFPLTSFRLKNMTTDNIYEDILPEKYNVFNKIGYEDGVKATLSWIRNQSSEE